MSVFKFYYYSSPRLTWRDVQYIIVKTSSLKLVKTKGHTSRNAAGLVCMIFLMVHSILKIVYLKFGK